MKVFELLEDLKDVDGNCDIVISIESGRSFSFSDDVGLIYDKKNNELRFEGEESGYEQYLN